MECKKEGHPDMVYKFSSTSKISFPGSDCGDYASDANLAEIREQMKIRRLGMISSISSDMRDISKIFTAWLSI